MPLVHLKGLLILCYVPFKPQDQWIRAWWSGIWPPKRGPSASSDTMTPSPVCISPRLAAWWQLHLKTEQLDCGHQPCESACSCMVEELCCGNEWHCFQSVPLMLCFTGKESRQFSKLTWPLFAVSLSPMMSRNWWLRPMTSLSKCGVFNASVSSTPSISTPTGCAVLGTRQHHILSSFL